MDGKRDTDWDLEHCKINNVTTIIKSIKPLKELDCFAKRPKYFASDLDIFLEELGCDLDKFSV